MRPPLRPPFVAVGTFVKLRSAYSALRKSDAKSGQWVVIGLLQSIACELDG